MRALTSVLLVSLTTLLVAACDGGDPERPPVSEASNGGASGSTSAAGGSSAGAGAGGTASAAGSQNAAGAAGDGSSGTNAGGSDAGAGGSSAGSGAGGGGAAGSAGSDAGAGGGEVGGAGGSEPQGMDWGAAKCTAAAEVGYEVGQSMGALVLKDCETGETATLDELCGAEATWIFVAHSHCPTCKATAAFTDEVADEVASKNVAVAHIMYDDNGTACATWKETYKLGGRPNLKVYEDPTGAAWQKIKTSNYTAPSAFLDRNRVVTFRAHGLTKAKVLSQIDTALAK
jgi:thiol-disulfide isomerase/thioredoxin